jgi:glycosyltransferase involved in cell wall biosynthesis
LDRIRDHEIIYKSTYILNGFDPLNYIPNEVKKNSNEITYIGSLIPSKGFHILARIWPRIKGKYPDAILNVIGNGQLYNRNSKLGKWQVADEEYEKQWRRYLSDQNGNIDSSVNFLGILGKEKIPVMQRSCIGIVNPSGKTENCPGSAIEFQASGTPVVSIAEWGLLDTVEHKKTGLLAKNDKDLIDNILYLLKNKKIAEKYGMNGIEFIKHKFSYKKISKEWMELFEEVYYNQKNKPPKCKENYFYRLKFLREWLRILKKYFPPFKLLPALIVMERKIKALGNKLKKDKLN